MKSRLSVEEIISWNRKFHIYIGLFFLFFILFFSISGLLLNHSRWEFTSFWKERKETKTETNLIIPANLDSASLVQNFKEQLNISGEISNVRLTAENIYFRAGKPGYMREINVNFKSSVCVSKVTAFNLWGKIRNLHTFNGSDKAHPEVQPNWLITNIWRLVMDLTAIALIFLSFSSWIMWYEVRKSYPAGIVVLVLGISGAIFFIFILRIL